MKKPLLVTLSAILVLLAAVQAQPARQTITIDASGGVLFLANKEQFVSEFVVRVKGGSYKTLRLKVNGPDAWNRDLTLEGASGGQNIVTLTGPRLLKGTYSMTIIYESRVWKKTLYLDPEKQMPLPSNLSARFLENRSLELNWSPVLEARIYRYCLSETDGGGGSCFETQETMGLFPSTWNYKSGATYFLAVYARNYDLMSPKSFPPQTTATMAQIQIVAR